MAGELPKTIRDEEELGRSVFSSAAERRARSRGTIVRDVFLVRRGDDCVSVDRMCHASDETMARLASARGKERGSTFYGWAILTAGAARSNSDQMQYRRTIEASPLPDNRYHTNIVMSLPDADDQERRDIQKQHALALAKCSEWRPRPYSTA